MNHSFIVCRRFIVVFGQLIQRIPDSHRKMKGFLICIRSNMQDVHFEKTINCVCVCVSTIVFRLCYLIQLINICILFCIIENIIKNKKATKEEKET